MTTVFHKNKPVIQWKGKTFNQISSSIKYNTRSENKNYFSAQPNKIYRAEVCSKEPNCNYRTSIKIENINRPGGLSTTNSNKGLAVTLDIHTSNNTSLYPNNAIGCSNMDKDDHPAQTTNTSINNLDPAKIALRRLRSSGMTQNKFNINSTKNYFSDTKQYLNNRNRSFNSNQYFNIRKGNSSSIPGTQAAINNVYTPNTTSSCQKYYISSETSFNYFWLDSNSSYKVTVPRGEYDLNTLNNLLHSVMNTNNHYLLELPYLNKEFFLKFLYNSESNTISIESTRYDTTIHVASSYDSDSLNNIPNPIINFYPSIEVIDNDFKEVIGFPSGNYPELSLPPENRVIQGTSPSKISLLHFQIYYKPSNSQFATQGAVSSSSLIARKRYDNITNVGSSFRSAFGKQTMNAIAYGSSEYGYTIKDKIGYPTVDTPVFKDGKMCRVRKFKYRLA